MSRVIAVIPARGDSKGMLNKNVSLLGGFPLIAHTIKDALSVTDEVYVSTNDEEIRRQSIAYGALVVGRPENISGDSARSEWAVAHVLDGVVTSNDREALVIFLQCTSPFRTPSDLEDACTLFENSECDTLFSGYELYPYIWAGSERLMYPEGLRFMRQDKRPAIVEDGSFYIGRPEHYTRYSDRLHGKTIPYIHPKWCGTEIDDEWDLRTADHMYSFLRQSGKL